MPTIHKGGDGDDDRDGDGDHDLEHTVQNAAQRVLFFDTEIPP